MPGVQNRKKQAASRCRKGPAMKPTCRVLGLVVFCAAGWLTAAAMLTDYAGQALTHLGSES